ncbi:MAG: hypothetical protein ACPL3B_00915 [Fervidobacterium sp.]
MSDLLEIENKIKAYIEKEIYQTNFTERPRDPLGFSIYAFFLLKNKVASPALDNMIDWINSWIDIIINKEELSRFVDREITSALFGYYALKTNGLLKISVSENKLIKLLSSSISDNLYFGNLTYSILILLSLTDKRSELPFFDRIIERIKDNIEGRTIINDAKNLVFTSLLLEKLKERSSLNKLVDICFRKIAESDVRFDDRIYYSWVVWNYRKAMEKDLPTIRNFVEDTLKNSFSVFEEKEIDDSIKEVYGIETKVGISRIMLATYLDLLIDFNKTEIEISPFSYAYIKQRLIDFGWTQAWTEFELGIKEFKEERLPECCNSLRMGLLIVWKNVCEKLEKKEILVSPGKTVDIAPLKKCLENHNFPADAIGLIERSWAYVSERAHIEKRKESLSDYEVRFGIQLTFSVVEYLLRFISQQPT